MGKQKNELKFGIILNYINMAIGNLIPIFYTPIMLSILGQNEYGLYKLSSSVTSYLGLISLGLGSAVTRYLIKAKIEGGQEAEENMLGLFLLIFRFIAFLALIIGTFITFNLDIWYSESLNNTELKRMQIIVFIMVCHMALSFSVSPYISIVTAREKYIFFQWMSILITTFTPIINLIALFLGYASIGLAVSSFAIALIARIIYFLYVKFELKIKARYNSMPINAFKEIFIFSFWIFIANIVSQLYNATDTLMIGAIPALGTTAVAIYNIGTVFNSMANHLSTGISSLLMPKTNKLVFEGASNKELTDYSILVGRLQTYISSILLVGFVIFGKPLIHFYVGDNYLEAYWITLFLLAPSLIPLSQSVCLSILIAKNQHRFRSIMYLFVAIINVIFTWIVLKDWGIKGAAFISGVALIIGHGFILNWYYWKKTGLEINRFWKEIFKVLRIPILICIPGILLTSYLNLYKLDVLIAGIFIFLVVILVCQWKFSFNEYEKGLILKPLNKLQHKNNNY